MTLDSIILFTLMGITLLAVVSLICIIAIMVGIYTKCLSSDNND